MRSIHFAGAALAALVPAAAWAQQAPAPKPGDTAAAADGSGQTIVVTASPFAHGIDQTPAITSRVDSEQILKSGGASIADALSNVPGIASTGFAAGASRPIIRGMDANRVRLLENGTSSSDVSDIGPDHGVPIDPLAARSIEVVRGAGTLRYGSQAIGGVVNAINDRVPMSLPTKPFSGELTGSYGSAADTLQGSALTDLRVGDFALHADGFYRHAGDYSTPLGTQVNSYFHGHGASAGGSYFFGGSDDSHVGAAIEQYNAEYGIPSDVTHIDMKQTKLLTRSVVALGSGLFKTFKFDGSYGDYQHSEKNPDGSTNATFKNREWDGRAELLLNPLGPAQNSAIGFEYRHRAFSALGEASSYLLPTTTESAAGYAFIDTQVADPLHLELSGRVEHVRVSGTPASDIFTRRSYTPVSGAIGALFDVAKAVKLGLTFSSTGRAPAITELFARGGHDGPGTYETGNPELKVERANSLEGTLRVRAGPFRFDGSVYSSWFRNFIYGDLTGRTCDAAGNCIDGPGRDFRELNYRQQGAHFRGLEGKGSYRLLKTGHGTLSANVLGDYTRATFSDGSNVPRIPPYRIGGGLDWESDAVDAGFTLIHVARQDKYGAYDTPTPGYDALSAEVSWRPFREHPGVELTVVGQNFANQVERNASSINRNLVVSPGRSIRLVLKVATD